MTPAQQDSYREESKDTFGKTHEQKQAKLDYWDKFIKDLEEALRVWRIGGWGAVTVILILVGAWAGKGAILGLPGGPGGAFVGALVGALVGLAVTFFGTALLEKKLQEGIALASARRQAWSDEMVRQDRAAALQSADSAG